MHSDFQERETNSLSSNLQPADDGETERQHLQALVASLSARVEALERCTGNMAASAVTSATDLGKGSIDREVLSRARLLKSVAVGFAGAIGVVALSGGGATPALAASKDTNYTAYGTDATYTPDTTIGFDASDKNAGFTYGVEGKGSLVGVLGTTDSDHGYGVGAVNSSSSKSAISLLAIISKGYAIGAESGSGIGVYGLSQSGTGVRGDSVSGPAIHGQTKAKNHSAVFAENTGAGMGIHATSQSGRGGVFGGGAAALQITPSKSFNHPHGGQLGDLFLDGRHRLWFCKRGGSPAVWIQLA
jgi:hypothetical protein